MGKKIAKVLGMSAPKPPKIVQVAAPAAPAAPTKNTKKATTPAVPKPEKPAEIPDADVVALNAAMEDKKRMRSGRAATLLTDDDYLGS